MGIVQRAPWVRWRKIGDRMYLYDDRLKNVHVINSLGASIWMALARPAEPNEVAVSLAPQQPDNVLEFIQELARLGCIISG